METSSALHALATLFQGKKTITEQETGEALELVWTIWTRGEKKLLALPVTIPTTLNKLPSGVTRNTYHSCYITFNLLEDRDLFSQGVVMQPVQMCHRKLFVTNKIKCLLYITIYFATLYPFLFSLQHFIIPFHHYYVHTMVRT